MAGLLVDASVESNSGPFKMVFQEVRNDGLVSGEAPNLPAQNPGDEPPINSRVAPNSPPTSIETRLTELKQLHEKGLISTEIYLEKQRTILNELK